ncbi:thiamine pyrophosphate-dependent enzyme [Lutimaribacter sp. EGI FJ00015]|uniref:Thiamine pyrophosphate-dependent enzyme n=1 Tax=Lutimaribacter degradans TaxID=2945989 RepID=A0ACC5ZUM2_9RHOB|nr:alpha-ketoacid dehydrogenase subunit alpha/beta [Lutimaribacter sp. EGI FJ00013]MCM2561089.1 thiamine pyrophosphate-dependent enzyme [Lutimaribacter sp. EGI FJ00013]MCO0611962.1 thiamine pyrophosphate-dependent enzyme [Lutimaribacter sp. EGI FJ00015]MCO0634917.1 thiamine pyrophosphate-dependent enzyme [Lutimaribacter sp. EGI FJ00014]
MDPATRVHEAFLARVGAGNMPPVSGRAAAADLSGGDLLALFRAQVASRQLDRMARVLQSRGQGFYTIGSSGHEGNAAIAQALRVTDPAFLHYRDAAFQIARAGQMPGQTPLWDMLLSFTAASDDPTSGGRHKVLGSKALNIPPQTSTIASHLPKAMGAAFAVGMSRRMPLEAPEWPADSVVMCSFGDASLNHSTAQGALNTAGWTTYQGTPLPLLFVCEDNGIGISVKTPKGWVGDSLRTRAGLEYFACDGLDIVDTYKTARQAADWVRKRRKPAVLHMSCVRLYGHAGADVEASYRPKGEIAEQEANDPLIHTAARLMAEGVADGADVLKIYHDIWHEVESLAEKAAARPKLQTADDVMASLVPPARELPRLNGPSVQVREQMFGPADLRALDEPQPMNKLLNLGLADLMLATPGLVMAGEDIGKKGGVYGITKGLQARFGPGRVIDSLLDEQSILGLAIGMGQQGYIPMPEIQFLAYLHNAQDQIRGEAATLPFFSNGQYANPMVLRIAGLGYQKGFGGHFHNDNSLAVLRDIPGVMIGCPSTGADAVAMHRAAVRLAREQARVVVMVEPIALYPMRDLHEKDDGGWLTRYPDAGVEIAPGHLGMHGQGTDLAIVTYGNGHYLSRQAQARLAADGIDARVIDLRWLAPLDPAAIMAAVEGCDRVLIVDECRRTGSQSEALMALMVEHGRPDARRLSAEDCFIATGPAYAATLPSADGIVTAARDLCA